MGAAFVIHRVLNELEAGDARGIERLMVGAAGIAHGKRIHAKITKRLHPRFKDRLDPGILLHVNAANLAGAVIHVEIDRDLCLLRLSRHRPIFPARDRWIALSVRIVGWRTRTKVLRHIPL